MFETAELGRKVSREEYDREVPELRMQLIQAQNELRQSAKFSVIIVVAGLEASGKGETVNALAEWMDPRFLETQAFDHPTDEEAERPAAWRFWRVLPPKGRIAVFFVGWYAEAIYPRLEGDITGEQFERILHHINVFERQLTYDGTLLLKFWFHIPKKVEKKRLEKYSADPKQLWRVSPQDWRHLKQYDEIVALSDQALRQTSTPEAPWTIVEGTDHRYRELTVAKHIVEAITSHSHRLESRGADGRNAVPATPAAGWPTILSTLDLTQRLEYDAYREELGRLQTKLSQLSREAQERGTSTVLVFEGWDAAGKGGAIRRITRALDARCYRVVAIGAPTDEEKARQYLWRFWRHLPRAGRMTIFDRSWYGRVLVERVEGFATDDEWRRAYKDINDFEELLVEHGIVLLKFWLHIDKDEQGRRFQEREQVPYKQYKISAEDYRNREKWTLYEAAVNDMVERTSTGLAPWTLVESNDKRFARCRVLRVLCDRLEAALKPGKS